MKLKDLIVGPDRMFKNLPGLAKATGLSKPTLSSILNGKYVSKNEDRMIEIIAEKTGIGYLWLKREIENEKLRNRYAEEEGKK